MQQTTATKFTAQNNNVKTTKDIKNENHFDYCK